MFKRTEFQGMLGCDEAEQKLCEELNRAVRAKEYPDLTIFHTCNCDGDHCRWDEDVILDKLQDTDIWFRFLRALEE